MIEIMVIVPTKMVSNTGPRIHTISHATPRDFARLKVQLLPRNLLGDNTGERTSDVAQPNT